MLDNIGPYEGSTYSKGGIKILRRQFKCAFLYSSDYPCPKKFRYTQERYNKEIL